MLIKKIENDLNEQINKELYSAYLYLSMSNFCTKYGVSGFANWFILQAKEEKNHAKKIYDYIQNRGGNIELKEIKKPDIQFTNLENLFIDTLSHEQFISASIHGILVNALSENDFPTVEFLHWFIKEQVEEEKNVDDILKELKFIGDDKSALLMLDTKLGERN